MRIFARSFAAVCIIILVACNNKDHKANEADKNTSAETETASTDNKTTPGNQPKSYTAVFAPDSAILGKSSEAFIKVTGATAVALTDPDGKDNGIELVVKLQVTNREKIGEGSQLSVSYADARLQLDNGTSIPASTGSDFLRAEPESSSKIESWTFEIPAGAKPSALNLFMDGTRVSMAVALK